MSTMFPLQPTDDLFSIISNTKIQGDYETNPEDHNANSHGHDFQDHNLYHASQPGRSKERSRSGVLISFGGSSKDHHEAFEDPKKKMHRENERQRRQEMNALYASLRSLLPVEYIKGKRAISDHMNASVNYINHLQRKIKELETKRDELKAKSGHNLGSLGPDSGSSHISSSVSSFHVRPCVDGVEIIVRSASIGDEDQHLALSKVLQVLLEEGISVGSCVSARTDGVMMHTIQSEACDTTHLDLSRLQSKLDELS